MIGELARSARRRESGPPGGVGEVVALARGRGPDRRRSCRGRRPDDVRSVSPVDASARYLAHLARAWQHAHGDDDAALADQEVLVTVPASFDAAARELTLRAAARGRPAGT